MFPVLLEFENLKINSYGFFIAIGYLSALLLGQYLAKSRNLSPGPLMDLGFIAIVSGVAGARILFVLTRLDYFNTHPGEIFDFWNGGLVFYGGLIFAAICCLAFGLWKKMPLRLSSDIVLSGVALAHAFGRIGCFAAGCCHGTICLYPWAVHLDSLFVEQKLRGQPIHPVQLYESFSLFLMAGILAWLVRAQKTKPGTVTLVYVGGYALIRFVLEFFRGDQSRGFVAWGLLSTSQSIALILFCFAGGIFIRRFWSQNL